MKPLVVTHLLRRHGALTYISSVNLTNLILRRLVLGRQVTLEGLGFVFVQKALQMDPSSVCHVPFY